MLSLVDWVPFEFDAEDVALVDGSSLVEDVTILFASEEEMVSCSVVVFVVVGMLSVTVTGVLPCTKPIDYRYTAPTPYWPLGFLNFDIDFVIVEASCLHFYGEFCYLQGVSKKMVFCGKTAITSFKLIQNAKSGGVLENSGYLLHYGH